MLHDDEIALRQVGARPTPPYFSNGSKSSAGLRRHLGGEVDRRAAGHETVSGSSPSRMTRSARQLRRDEVQVRQLGDGVADLLVDRAGDLAALHVDDRNVHVRRRDRGRQRLVAIRDRHDGVGLEVVEHRRELDQAEAGGLRRRRRGSRPRAPCRRARRSGSRRARSPGRRCRSDRAAPRRRRRAAARGRDGRWIAVQRGPDAGVARTRGDDDADFSFGHVVEVTAFDVVGDSS